MNLQKNIYSFFTRYSEKTFIKLCICLFAIADLVLLLLLPRILADKFSAPALIKLLLDNSTNSNLAHDINTILYGTFGTMVLGIIVLNVLCYRFYFSGRKLGILYVKTLAVSGTLLSVFIFIDGVINFELKELLFLVLIPLYLFHLLGLKNRNDKI